MSSGREPLDFLRDMLDAMEKTERFTEGMNFEQFANDDRTTLAVIKAVEIAGEAAKNVPKPVRTRHPSVPWRDMATMRDRLTHGYFAVSLTIVWSTVKQDLPGFTADEDKEHLGESLMLPPWLEEYRERIEAFLPRVRQPYQKG